MKLMEALRIVETARPAAGEVFRLFLACGFTPLHLQTFLTAHLQQRLPHRRVEISAGLYGDPVGNWERLEQAGADAATVVLEWPDFDPRLGLRHRGGWRPRDLPDILDTVSARAARYQQALERASRNAPVALCLPTLPLPPASYFAVWQASDFELQLRQRLATFGAHAARCPNVRLVNPQRLDQCSPLPNRLDVKAELAFGFPYRVPHASVVAELLARLLQPPAPKKGLITDLDDTLWHGILGEDGPQGVSWDLDHHSQIHALYQQLLDSLAEAGVLIAVASKNDPVLAEEAFRRDDLILAKKSIFPLEISWGSKVEAVGRILRKWNVDPDSVVFVDDSAMEVAEVKAAYPDIECLLFLRQDDQAVYALLERLRDLFGKNTITEEDALRRESLRTPSAIAAEVTVPSAARGVFLEQADAEVFVSFAKDPADPRPFELVNKTNQFNLNGKRWAEAAWRAHLQDPAAFVLVAAYQDKFGPLGKIAVVAGRRQDHGLSVETWVMSCRAFGRRIEHQCLEQLFRKFGPEALVFDYQPTPRNGPLREFLEGCLGRPPAPWCRLTKAVFAKHCPALFHRVTEVPHA
jgi:FkbH-like protein